MREDLDLKVEDIRISNASKNPQGLSSKGRIGIITLYGNSNYGNKLQNYAVQELYRMRGFEAETIVYKKRSWKRKVKSCIRQMNVAERKREKALAEFSKRYLTVKEVVNESGQIEPALSKEYDFFSVGSDQVWNPLIRKNERDNFFLSFANRNQRICLAPSISTETIPADLRRLYVHGLEGFPYLSCREEEGADLVKKLTGRDCQHLIDPTLAIPREKWREFEENCPVNEPYALLFFLGDISEEVSDLVDRIRRTHKMNVICPSDARSEYYAINPNQFVSLIDNARIVLTDSFHVTAFSINLNTPFYAFNRKSSQSVSEKMSSRIASLTRKTGLSARHITEISALDGIILSCDFTLANDYLKRARSELDEYLDKCLTQKGIRPLLLPENECTGCGTCSLICPEHSIEMKLDDEGFMMPSISRDTCINCGKCVSRCPALIPRKSSPAGDVYAAFNTDESELKDSSSGAVFPILAEYVLKQGGAVAGASFDDSLNVVHTIASSIEEMQSQRFAKYVQSNASAVFQSIECKLNNGVPVLFTGTPCQAAGLKSYLKKSYDNLYVVDCSCHGVPAPKLWNKWMHEFETIHACAIKKVNFRAKTGENWNQYSVVYETDNGKLSFPKNEDVYLKAFRQNLSLRKSCFACHFKGWDRCADLTVGDFWGIEQVCPEMAHETGTSMILVHTDQGKKLLGAVSSQLTMKKVKTDRAESVNDATWSSVKLPTKRKEFMTAALESPLSETMRRFEVKKKNRIIKRIFRKLKQTVVR